MLVGSGSSGERLITWLAILFRRRFSSVARFEQNSRAILLMPGLYTNNAFITHGGFNDDARLTIEAETPGTVTLDTAKREYSVLQLENCGFVTIRGIRFLRFFGMRFYAVGTLSDVSAGYSNQLFNFSAQGSVGKDLAIKIHKSLQNLRF